MVGDIREERKGFFKGRESASESMELDSSG